MDSLHAPWRIEYILAPKPKLDESVFTRIAQSSDDVGNYVITRDKTCYALLNRYPYTGGHLMIVPYKESPDLEGLSDDEVSDLLKPSGLISRLRTAMQRRASFHKSDTSSSLKPSRSGDSL